MRRRRIFVDMDGTLAVWNGEATIEEVCAPGYFAHLDPQIEVVDAVKRLLDLGAAEVFVLSAVLEEFPHVIPDKNEWLDQYLPEIDCDHRVFAPVSAPKYDAVPGGVLSGDVLLDDYSKNLREWTSQPGAIGVKLLNGINHSRGTWKGAKVHKNEGAVAIAAAILTQTRRKG